MLCPVHFDQMPIQLRNPVLRMRHTLQDKEIINAKEQKCNILKCILTFHSSKYYCNLISFLLIVLLDERQNKYL